VKFIIPIPEKISLNKIYSGIHFRQRNDHKDDYHFAVMSANPKPYTGDFPIHAHYHFKLRGNRLDISNHAYMQKMTEDGLVACGVIPDDSPKYVNAITITAEKAKKDEDEVVIVTLSR
jgi:hypothetical protein